jgi:hypothetical protein
MNDRGVSTIIGLVLLIGLVAVGSVGIVVIGGGETDQLVDRTTGEQADVTMSQLRDEVGSIVQANEESAGVSFPKADDENIVIEDHSRIEVTAYGLYSNDTVGSCTYGSSMGSLRYGASSDATLGYEANGIFRLQDGTSVLVSPPNLQYRETKIDGKLVRTLDVPVVDIQSGTGGAGGNSIAFSKGNNTAQVGLCEGQPPLAHVDNATIRVENTDFHDGWFDYAEEEFGGIGGVTIDHDPDDGSNGAGTVTIRDVDLGEIPPSQYDAENVTPTDDDDDSEDDEDGPDDPYANDQDQDGINDSDDNCKFVPNSDQLNQDGDMAGNKCETIWAYDDDPGATTVHEVNWVRAGTSVAGDSLDELEITYDGPVGLGAVGESDATVTVLDANGTVYSGGNYGIDDAEGAGNTLIVTFSGNHTIREGDTIRVKFADVENPQATIPVDLRLNDDGTAEGDLEINGTNGAESPSDDSSRGWIYPKNESPGASTTHTVTWDSGKITNWGGADQPEQVVVDYPGEVNLSEVDEEDVTVTSSPGGSPDRATVENVSVSDDGTKLTINVSNFKGNPLNPSNTINVTFEDAVNPDVAGAYETNVTVKSSGGPIGGGSSGDTGGGSSGETGEGSSSPGQSDESATDTGCLGIGETSESCDGESGSNSGDSSLPPNGDVDNDGVPNSEDNCKYTPNPLQYDADGDGEPLAVDDDGDGKLNTEDPDEGGNECDNDNDNDGVPDDEDPTPYPGMADSNNTYVIDVTGNDVVVCDDGQTPEECKAN